jgi:ABC-type transporter lipoprotein component MlaA
LIGDDVVDQAFDPYVFVRDAYLQRREFVIDEHNQNRVHHYVAEDGVKHRKTQSLSQGRIAY